MERILRTGHKYRNIQTDLEIVHKTYKGPKLNTLEQFENYKHHTTHKNEFKIIKLHTTTIYYDIVTQ